MIPHVLIFLHTVLLTWQAPPQCGVCTYSAYRALYGQAYVRRAANLKDVIWTDTKPTSGRTYCYYVTATQNKVETGPSNSTCVSIPKP